MLGFLFLSLLLLGVSACSFVYIVLSFLKNKIKKIHTIVQSLHINLVSMCMPGVYASKLNF